MAASIHDAAVACGESFAAYWMTRKRDPWIQQNIIDFNIWSSESGALLKGTRSLDERLCLRHSYRRCLLRTLNRINEYTRDALGDTMLHHKSSSGGQTTKRQGTEMDSLRMDIGTMLQEVVSLTDAVLRSLPCTMLWEADDKGLTDDLETNLGGFRLELHDQFRKLSGMQWDPHSPKTVVWNRIIDANVTRRKRFLYAISKRKKEGICRPAFPWPRRSKVRVPDPPAVQRDSKTIQCPYCLEYLPAYFAEPDMWRKHILVDLEPYCCVVPDCNDHPHRLYGSSTAWENHMSSHFQSELDIGYIEKSDAESRTANISRNITCPLCPGPMPETDILAHISWCLLDFAIKSIPQEPSETTDNIGSQKVHALSKASLNIEIITTQPPPTSITHSDKQNDEPARPQTGEIHDDQLLSPASVTSRSPFHRRSPSQPLLHPSTLAIGAWSPASTGAQQCGSTEDVIRDRKRKRADKTRSMSDVKILESYLYGGIFQGTTIAEQKFQSLYKEQREVEVQQKIEMYEASMNETQSRLATYTWRELSMRTGRFELNTYDLAGIGAGRDRSVSPTGKVSA